MDLVGKGVIKEGQDCESKHKFFQVLMKSDQVVGRAHKWRKLGDKTKL